MNLFKAPNRPIPHLNESPRPWVFLAGSIEMGAAEDWQTRLTEAVKSDPQGTLFNPRRDMWETSWGPGHPELIRQINWELDFLIEADIILMYLDPMTKSPISLLELGLNTYGTKGRMLVCCPDGFYRKTNVEVVCKRFDIQLYHTFEDMILAIQIEGINAAVRT